MTAIPIPTDLMQAVLYKVEQTEKDLQSIVGFPIKVRLEIQPEEINEIVLQSLVCTVFGVSWKDVMSRNRERQTMYARHAYFFFCRMILKKSFKQIGKEVGARDHTTVMHGINSVNNMVETGYGPFVYSFDKIKKKLFNETEANV